MGDDNYQTSVFAKLIELSLFQLYTIIGAMTCNNIPAILRKREKTTSSYTKYILESLFYNTTGWVKIATKSYQANKKTILFLKKGGFSKECPVLLSTNNTMENSGDRPKLVDIGQVKLIVLAALYMNPDGSAVR